LHAMGARFKGDFRAARWGAEPGDGSRECAQARGSRRGRRTRRDAAVALG